MISKDLKEQNLAKIAKLKALGQKLQHGYLSAYEKQHIKDEILNLAKLFEKLINESRLQLSKMQSAAKNEFILSVEKITRSFDDDVSAKAAKQGGAADVANDKLK